MGRRSAQEEREDVLAFLRAEKAKFERASYEEPLDVADRLKIRASCLRTMIVYIERGDHIGTMKRS